MIETRMRSLIDSPAAACMLGARPDRSRWAWGGRLAAPLALALLMLALVAALPTPIARAEEVSLQLTPDLLRLDCLATDGLRLSLSPPVAAELVRLELSYDPRVLAVERLLAPSGRFELAVDTDRHVDLAARATEAAEGQPLEPAFEHQTIRLRPRRAGAEWPELLLGLRLRGLVAGSSPIRVSAEIEHAGGRLQRYTARAELIVACAGMTPVPEQDERELRSETSEDSERPAPPESVDTSSAVAPVVEASGGAGREPARASGRPESSEATAAPRTPSGLPVAGARPPAALALRPACWHRIGLGDSLLELAAVRGLGLDELLRASHLPSPRLARRGMLLRLPGCAGR